MAREKKELTKQQKISVIIVKMVCLLIVVAIVVVVVVGINNGFANEYNKKLHEISEALEKKQSVDSKYTVTADNAAYGKPDYLYDTTKYSYSVWRYDDDDSSRQIYFEYHKYGVTSEGKRGTETETIELRVFTTSSLMFQTSVNSYLRLNGFGYGGGEIDVGGKSDDVTIQYMADGKVTTVPNYTGSKESELVTALTSAFEIWDNILYNTTGVHLTIED